MQWSSIETVNETLFGKSPTDAITIVKMKSCRSRNPKAITDIKRPLCKDRGREQTDAATARGCLECQKAGRKNHPLESQGKCSPGHTFMLDFWPSERTVTQVSVTLIHSVTVAQKIPLSL